MIIYINLNEKGENMKWNLWLFLVFSISILLIIAGASMIIVFANFAAVLFGGLISFAGSFLAAISIWEIVFDAIRKAKEYS